MTDIMLNIPRKVVQEYSTPMMFCTVPTDPLASYQTLSEMPRLTHMSLTHTGDVIEPMHCG